MTYLQLGSLTALFAVLAGCSPAEPAGDTSTDTTEAPGGSSGETTAPDDTGTTAIPTTGTPDPGTGSSTGAELPAPVCVDPMCAIECTQPREFTLADGEPCVCDAPVGPTDEQYLDCPLPSVCGEPEFASYICVIQALRYGVVGAVGYRAQAEDVGGGSVRFQILEPGLAQAFESSFVERACCDEISEDHARWALPFTLEPPDSGHWQWCLSLAEQGQEQHFSPTLPACLRPKALAVECSGAPPDECPPPPPPPDPDAPCEATCPMMNDGVCDEPIGTGLCPDGCDPTDCACPEDVEGQCDDVRADGPCPLASDPDCDQS